MFAWPMKPIRIGPAPSRESYLRIDKLMEAARRAGCDALHPGYGFLAENPELARACAANNITFIGPSPEAMERLGSKTAARQLAARAGVPMVPGTKDPIENLSDAGNIAHELGYPVLLKAVAGGGGKGMRLVAADSEMAGGVARRLFGSAERVWRRAPLSRKVSLTGRATSKFKFLATRTATSCISASANVPFSVGTKK